MTEKKSRRDKVPKGWTQTDRTAHDVWAELTVQHPPASALMHLLAARCNSRNKVTLTHKELKLLMKVRSVTTVKNTLATLAAHNFILVVSNARKGSVNTYTLNDHAVWASSRDDLKKSEFKADLKAPEACHARKKPFGSESREERPYENPEESIDPETGEVTTLADSQDPRDAA